MLPQIDINHIRIPQFIDLWKAWCSGDHFVAIWFYIMLYKLYLLTDPARWHLPRCPSRRIPWIPLPSSPSAFAPPQRHGHLETPPEIVAKGELLFPHLAWRPLCRSAYMLWRWNFASQPTTQTLSAFLSPERVRLAQTLSEHGVPQIPIDSHFCWPLNTGKLK